MLKEGVLHLFLDFEDEFKVTLNKSKNFCIALFDSAEELLFSNDAMTTLLDGRGTESLINPTFKKLLQINTKDSLIFEGVLTIGNINSINSSIDAKIFRKNNKILILGEISALQLLEQNSTMHLLNVEINNLQRKLIKEKYLLQQTLNELNIANSKLNELNATKDKFFSIIAHDLKSPFNSILGFSELLSSNISKYSPEMIEKFSMNIFKSAQSTFELLENLLTWSNLQKGKIEPVFNTINLNKTIETVVELCRPFANSKNISIEINVEKPISVVADIQMLNTIIRNLITNSIKFTHPLGLVKIETKILENEVLITVLDTGIGIEKLKLNNLFSIGCELSVRGTNNEKGTGLGLILCKDFVEIQGGKIWVESELGKGSSFIFTLPIVK
ncbi:sensor histidine kinase [Lutibacter sp. HS1-25]|uniref:sensor histidine kinase n=1 Tax=Lutibacter sp. HS1-25 TaxID=2485000 RepID=UPI0010137279|nr:HAMP domain-containing sensor histidine kinase [Lutibacter sp. HS1-25]RXP57093.1 sensor histidine kinase [Lutibacter sp. HS1-25]